MDAKEFRAELERSGVVLVVRLSSAAGLDEVAKAAADGGVRLFEVTSNTPGGLEWLASRGDHHPELRLGVGTVIDDDTATSALEAGAEFLVAPHVDTDAIHLAAERSIAYVPGALTPTEALEADRAGAAGVKLFPLTQLGPAYVRDLRGPLPDIPFVPIGGISERNAADYIRAGAVAVGVGASFVNDEIVTRGDFSELTDRLAALTQTVSRARQDG